MLALACAVVASVVLTAEPERPWVEKAQSNGVTVYTRERPGTGVKEIKAVGEIDAPPARVLKIIADYARYPTIMPYTEECRVLATEAEGKVTHYYSVINAPFVSRRDYALRVVDQSDWKDGKGFLRIAWTLSDKGPEPKKGAVRVAVNEGMWTLEPLADGKKTRGTYVLFTDPGGSLPLWVVNKANSSAIPDIFESLRKHSKDPEYAEK